MSNGKRRARRKNARVGLPEHVPYVGLPCRRCCRCGDFFEAVRSDAKFCTAACKQAAYRERQRQGE
jgi:hypothetical protein